MNSKRSTIFSLLVAAITAIGVGCSTPNPRDAYVAVQAETDALRNQTAFSGALSCMDDLLIAHRVPVRRLTGVGIPDATGEVRTGGRDMLISAISHMTRRSGAFQYVDWEYDNKELQILYQLARDEDPGRYQAVYHGPDYYIRGAITQLDEAVNDGRHGGGIGVEYKDYGADVGADKNATMSIVSLDLSVGDVLSRQIMPGLTANNSLVVRRKGAGFTANIDVKYVGASYSWDAGQSEGMHQAVRTLVELAAVELLGKLARVPYWECLQVESTNPQIRVQLNEWWQDMDERQQTLFVQNVLIQNGYLQGPADGVAGRATRDAIGRYQAEHGLVPNGRPGVEVYAAMLGADRPISAGEPETYVEQGRTPDPVADEVPVRTGMELALESDRGKEPIYAPRERLQMAVTLSESGYLYCYYQDANGTVAQIFPNRFSPGAYVPGGTELEIPGRSSAFQIEFENAGSMEEVACMGSNREVAMHLPRSLRKPDLTPLPVEALDEVIAAYREIDRTGMGVERLPIMVTSN